MKLTLDNREFSLGISICLIFLIFQIFFSLSSSDDFLSSIGILQLILIFFTVFGFWFSSTLRLSKIYVVVIVFHIICLFLYYQFFLINYQNPLGYNPKDAQFYHELALKLSNLNFSDTIYYFQQNLDLGDYGYPFVLRFIYMLGGGQAVLLSKIFSILFHVITCSLVVKIANLIYKDQKLSKIVLILYGLNPATIFFIASGLKEPLFALLVALAFYLLLKAYLEKKYIYILAGFVTVFCTGMFRSAYPIFLILSFASIPLFNTHGKHKRLKQIGILVLGGVILGIAFLFVQTELTEKLGYDQDTLAETRLGRIPGVLDYIFMSIGGLIGPFPTFDYNASNQLGLLQSAGNFFKIFFSYFFLVGAFLTIKDKIKIMYGYIAFILINLIVLVMLAAALDYRFLYPFMPLYFLVLAYGYRNYKKKVLPQFLKLPIYMTGIFLLIILYNFR